ncbi:MAG: ABC transporter substrate-binding protein [Pseudomonadales bacterium]|nr:ABC transporter substrate-binding protein [Pseudomonadales bacterium]
MMDLRFFRQAAVLFLSLLMAQQLVAAQLNTLSPHQRIDETTTQLLTLISDAKGYFEQDPQRFYGELSTIIDPLVDFKSFTRSVMGDYGTKAYYKSLSKAQRSQYKKDYGRFVNRFQEGLINTYGKGLLAFSGQKIVVEPADEKALSGIAAAKSVEVIQKIYGTEKNFTITYKMRPNKQGVWLIRNVSIESINVGQLYRNQFASAMDKNKGNFASVIDNWVVEAKDLDEESESIKESL